MADAHPFLSLPIKTMYRILQGCEKFSDLVALASSCKTLHTIWLSQAPALIWELAPTRILAFDSALIAVRATKIVADAQSNKMQPPHPFPVRELSGHAKKPLPEEMKAVFDFEHLVECVEWMMFHWEIEEPENEYGESPLLLEDGGQWARPIFYKIWRDRLYRGLYNILLAGAVCSRAYNAPFVLAEEEGRTDFLERCARCARGHTTLTNEDFEYLRRFPVYNFLIGDESDTGRWRDQEYETIFGPLAQWLIEDGERRGLEGKLKNSKIPAMDDNLTQKDWGNAAGSFDSSQTGSIREIKTLHGAYEHFHRKFSRKDDSSLATPDGHAAIADFQGQRKVTAVIFGNFQLDEIATPTTFEALESRFLLAKPTSKLPPVREVLHQLTREGPHFQDGHHPPPPEFQLFSFTLRRYFNLKWDPRIFDGFWYPRYRNELGGGDIFQVPYPEPFLSDSLVMYHVPVFSNVQNY